MVSWFAAGRPPFIPDVDTALCSQTISPEYMEEIVQMQVARNWRGYDPRQVPNASIDGLERFAVRSAYDRGPADPI